MLQSFRKLMLAILMPLVCSAEWVSPHALELEKKAPNALLPFPREVKWEKEKCPLP